MPAGSAIDIGDGLPDACRTLFDDAGGKLIRELHDAFGQRRDELLAARATRQHRINGGIMPGFRGDDSADWKPAVVSAHLEDRRVELQADATAAALLTTVTAPAGTVVASVADALPAPGAAIGAQANIADWLRTRGQLIEARRPALVFEPRLLEQHETLVTVSGKPVAAGLLDFALYVHHHRALLDLPGHGILLRIPGIASVEEATFWADVLTSLRQHYRLREDSFSVTAGIDSVSAAFEIDGILQQLKSSIAAISSNYHRVLRSFIHTFEHFPQFVLPDRTELSPGSHFLSCWGLNLVRDAHRRGVHAIAGCSVATPHDAMTGHAATHRQRAQYARLARQGFDGCSVVDEAELEMARDTFDRLVPDKHQLARLRADVAVSAADLLQVVNGRITEAGMRWNIRLALSGWIALDSAIAAASESVTTDGGAASIALAADQLWQWVRLDTGVLDDGRVIDAALFTRVLESVCDDLDGPQEWVQPAAEHLARFVMSSTIPAEFLLPAS